MSIDLWRYFSKKHEQNNKQPYSVVSVFVQKMVPDSIFFIADSFGITDSSSIVISFIFSISRQILNDFSGNDQTGN